ncbi:MAG: hypothetical protein JXA54_01615 [Candidatus Heimdallarchaeota archaeon]|nr:hypothetical protein [Candidatus Heimdallarchaeota archaeon]
MTNYIVRVAPDFLPLNAHEFIRHFSNLLTNKTFKIWIEYESFTKILGYACRSLFDTSMEYFCKNKDIIVATTPLHHTSFNDIIKKYVKSENIHIIGLNDNFNEIEELPELDKCDLVIITHLFGQDFNLSKLVKFKEKHKCLILEDRVQGGSLDVNFSHDLVDIAYYSMAMDKRPIALGGGFIHIRNYHKKIIDDLIEIINNYPVERTNRRFLELIKKIPTFFLYNSRFFLFSFISLLKLLNKFNRRISILKVSKSYRKKNPGFVRQGYLLKPSQGLLKSMYENYNRHKEAELVYTANYQNFINSLPGKVVKKFFPWYKGLPSITPYNTMLLDECLTEPFLKFLSDHHISSLPNPTYKLFNHQYKNEEKYKKFNNGIVYLPSTTNMKKADIIQITNLIKVFYIKNKLIIE